MALLPHTVLIIDDAAKSRALVRQLLTRDQPRSVVLIEATDADEGLRLWRKYQPDCVLLADTLSDQAGLEVLATIVRESGLWVAPVVFLAERQRVDVAVKVFKQGAQDYLAKNHLTGTILRRAILNAIEKVEQHRKRRQAEQSLLTGEQRWRALADIAPVGMFQTDAHGQTLYVNQRWCEIAGMAPEQAFGNGWARALHPSDQARVFAEWREAVATGAIFSSEYRFVDQAGMVTWVLGRAIAEVLTDGTIAGYVGTITDITERKRSETAREGVLAHEQVMRALAEQTNARLERLREITAALSDTHSLQQFANILLSQKLPGLSNHAGVVALLKDNNECLDVLAKHGYSKPVSEAWPTIPLDIQMPIPEVIRSGQPLWLSDYAEAVARYPGLAHIWAVSMSWAVLPLVVEQRVIGAWGISFATTQPFDTEDRNFLLALAHQCAQAIRRLQLFEIARHAQATAEEAVRLRDQFLAVATHELKNPLAALLGYAQLLQRRMSPNQRFNERDQRAINTIVGQAARLEQMLSNLLDVSRIEIGQMQIDLLQLDIGALAERVVEEVRVGLKTHTVVYCGPNAPLLVPADAMRLEQVVQNLIGNAIKYSPSGSTITVQVIQHGAHARLSIADQGFGIPEADLPHLFQRYFRADSAATKRVSGSGIGLYIVKEIVERHHGEVTVESVEGQGTTFVVDLPLAQEQPEASAARQYGAA